MNAEEIIKLHLGNLMVQIAMLQAENAELKAKLDAVAQQGLTQPVGPLVVVGKE